MRLGEASLKQTNLLLGSKTEEHKETFMKNRYVQNSKNLTFYGHEGLNFYRLIMCQHIATLFLSYHELNLIWVTVTAECVFCQCVQQILIWKFKSKHNIQQLHKVDLFNHITNRFVGSKPKKKLMNFHFITVRHRWLKSSTQCPKMYTHYINTYTKYSGQTLINCAALFNISNAWNVEKHQRNVDNIKKKKW